MNRSKLADRVNTLSRFPTFASKLRRIQSIASFIERETQADKVVRRAVAIQLLTELLLQDTLGVSTGNPIPTKEPNMPLLKGLEEIETHVQRIAHLDPPNKHNLDEVDKLIDEIRRIII